MNEAGQREFFGSQPPTHLVGSLHDQHRLPCVRKGDRSRQSVWTSADHDRIEDRSAARHATSKVMPS